MTKKDYLIETVVDALNSMAANFKAEETIGVEELKFLYDTLLETNMLIANEKLKEKNEKGEQKKDRSKY